MVKFFKKNNTGKLVEYELDNTLEKSKQVKKVNPNVMNLFSPRASTRSSSRPSTRSSSRPLTRSSSRGSSSRPPKSISPLAPLKIPSPGSIAPTQFKPYTYKSINKNKQKTFRLNINIENKNKKLLKRKLPIVVIRRNINNIHIVFDEFLYNYHDIFYYKYGYNEKTKDWIIFLLERFKIDLLFYVDNIRTIILDKSIVKLNTPLYNYYKTNMDKLTYEIEDTLLNIILTNSRVLRYQIKQLKMYIIHYITDIVN